MKIAAGVEMLALSAHLADGPSLIYPSSIWDEDNIILVDAGLPGQLQQMRDAFQKA